MLTKHKFFNHKEHNFIMDNKKRFELIKRNTDEIISESELKNLLKKKKKPVIYWGTAPTGRPHVGYFIPGIKIPQWKVPIPAMFFSGGLTVAEQRKHYLFDRKKDPAFQNNMAGKPESEELETKMIEKMIEVMEKEGAPPEQFKRLMFNI